VDDLTELAQEILKVNFNTFLHDHWVQLMEEWQKRTGRFLSIAEYNYIKETYGITRPD
jgi:hypothetical protein